MYLDANLIISHQVRPVPDATARLILPKHECCPLRVKIAFPKYVFLTSNLGQEHSTALPSVLHQGTGPWDLNGGLSIVVRWNLTSASSFFQAHPGMPKMCHGCVSNQDTPICIATLCWHWQCSVVLLSGTPVFWSREHSPNGHLFPFLIL